MQSERLGAVSAPPCVRWDRQLGDVSLWPIRWGLGRLLDWRERQRGNPAFTFLAAPSRKHRGFWKLLLIEGLRRIVFVGYFHRQHDHHLHDQFAVLPCGNCTTTNPVKIALGIFLLPHIWILLAASITLYLAAISANSSLHDPKEQTEK